MGLWDGLGTGLLGFGGSMITNLFNADSKEKEMEFNAAQAQINRDFQERMSNTAYQRAMEDMKKAGLNPILAYQKGGASAPSGSSASTTAQVYEDSTAKGISASLSSRMNAAQVENLAATNENLKTQNNLINAQAAQAYTAAKLNEASTAKQIADTDISRENLSVAQKQAIEANLGKKNLDTWMGQIGSRAGQFFHSISPAVTTGAKLLGR